ncbi:hypothetical protein EYZ11_007672 [Aspergillus tanneri]|uniref:Phytanoyl-CoA dioxygenase n=1 Tax=Aspergillus tanneri TaxID=1220188 RepID=A0A4S3JCF1_9EURO|nr:uncharacterized protein ATNIH1004_003176 [Aspergillus tanneri]KAA8650489.1 hypothetical protein ATNIH1004_003176 [Aspergillus tanneri]THC92859.1 hypothetical protein EYZ11_007672 [Aspergillus tanneri]
MALSNGSSRAVHRRLFHPQSIQLEEFKKICSQTTDKVTYSLASSVEKEIPIYNASTLDPLDPDLADRLQDEWHHALNSGPGVFVLKGMYHPCRYEKTLSSTNNAFQRIIEHERQSSRVVKGDHFATSGKNDRIWNSFSKHAKEDPSSFIDYYSNPWLRLVCESWLGPVYRVTAQVNVVKPGGAAQESHRDYHLGFQEVDRCAAFPRSIQLTSQYLTLQGAVAHSDMPERSGPTRFLPFSQTYEAGYLAWRREEFRAYFKENYTALPLALGDGLFFNPAVFHAAGENEMDAVVSDGGFHRRANLLQISSGLGKTMETIDTVPIVDLCWEGMVERYHASGNVLDAAMEAFVLAVADGYPFPTNLDRRPPAPSGMAPESEQEIIRRGLKEGWGRERVVEELKRMKLDSCA